MAGNQHDDNDGAPGDGWEIEDDLDKVETRKDVPPGRWLARVSGMEKKPTKDKTKDYFNLAFEILDCEKPEEESVIGGKVWDIFNVNQAALWKLKALISACGFDATGSRVPNLIGCEVVLDTFEDDYNGNKSIKTKRYKDPVKEGWTGLHEKRDASGSESSTDKAAGKDAAKDAKPAQLKTGGALAGKKLASNVKPTGGTKKDDDEVEV